MSNRPQSSQADTSELRKQLEHELEALHGQDDGHAKHMMMVDLDILAAQKQRWIKEELQALKPLIRDYDGNDMILDVLNDRIAALDAATGGQDKEGTIHATFYKDEIDVGNLEES